MKARNVRIAQICARAGRSFLLNSSGNVAISAAIAVIPLLVGVGAAVDYSTGVSVKHDLQVSADGAALAALSSGETDEAAMTATAKAYFDANFARLRPGLQPTVLVTFGEDTVTVTPSLPVNTSFMSLVGINSIDASTVATAIRTDGNPVCLLALNPTASQSISFEGNVDFDAIGCSVHTNSNSPEAIVSDGSVIVEADSFCAVGGYSGNEMSPTPKGNCDPVEDPYANLSPPVFAGCDHTDRVFTSGPTTASPGTYCGGLNFTSHSDVTFQPGVYVIRDGHMFMDAHSTLTGTGVTIYFTGDDTWIELEGNAAIDLKAPASGTYAGVVLAQDPASNPGTTSTIDSGAQIKLVGAVYFPTWTLDLGGSAAMLANSPAVSLVADSFKFRGNVDINLKADSAAAGLPENPAKTKSIVRLIE